MTSVGAAILPFISEVRDRRMSKRIPSQLCQRPNHIRLSPPIRGKRRDQLAQRINLQLTIIPNPPAAKSLGGNHIGDLFDVEFVAPRLGDFDDLHENINIKGDGVLLQDQLLDDSRLESVGGFFGGILLVALVCWRRLFRGFEELDEFLEDVLLPGRCHLCDGRSAGLAEGKRGGQGDGRCLRCEGFLKCACN
jgi:hypothetical protein